MLIKKKKKKITSPIKGDQRRGLAPLSQSQLYNPLFLFPPFLLPLPPIFISTFMLSFTTLSAPLLKQSEMHRTVSSMNRL